MRSRPLVIMDAGPLIQLAAADKLDMLLSFNGVIFIPDEVYFEAVDKFAWENQILTNDQTHLKAWIEKQIGLKRVLIAETYVGTHASADRLSGLFSPADYPKGLRDTAAIDFFQNLITFGIANETIILAKYACFRANVINDGTASGLVETPEACFLSNNSVVDCLKRFQDVVPELKKKNRASVEDVLEVMRLAEEKRKNKSKSRGR